MKNLWRMSFLWVGLWLALLAGSASADPITGVYRLTARVQPGMALDVYGFGNANGTSVQLWYANHTCNQQWLVESQGDGTYKISAYSGQNSLQVLDYAGGNTSNGNPVTTYEDTGSDNQRWYFQDTGGGWYRIIPKNAGPNSLQTLDMRNGNAAAAGSTANVYTYYGGDNQVFRLDWSGVAQVLSNPKKGLGGRENKIPALHASWFYNWGSSEPGDTPTGVEFVPMEWGYYGGDNSGWLQGVISQPGVKNILAFNEPDGASQANLDVNSALTGYQYLSNVCGAAGVPLGSPAAVHADDSWMQQFMQGCSNDGYRVDFVTIHWYGGNDPQGFLNYLDYVHWLYGKPVWVTEFCPADWSGSHGISPAQTADFMRAVVPAMNSRDYVQRYAWFSANATNDVLDNGALVNDDGTLTDLGRLYARL